MYFCNLLGICRRKTPRGDELEDIKANPPRFQPNYFLISTHEQTCFQFSDAEKGLSHHMCGCAQNYKGEGGLLGTPGPEPIACWVVAMPQ